MKLYRDRKTIRYSRYTRKFKILIVLGNKTFTNKLRHVQHEESIRFQIIIKIAHDRVFVSYTDAHFNTNI